MRPRRGPCAGGFRLGRMVLALVATGALPACSTSGRRLVSFDGRSQAASLEPFVAPAPSRPLGPLVSIPNGGGVRSVQDIRFADGLQQRIVLGGGSIDLRVRSGGSGESRDGVRIAKPTRAGIASEIASLRTGQPFRIVTQPLRNRYGPFGAALGTNCIYAWQWIEDVRGYELSLPMRLNAAMPASLRIQLCRSGRIDSGELLTEIERLSLVNPRDAERVLAIPRRRAAVARPRNVAEPAPAAAPGPARAPFAEEPRPSPTVSAPPRPTVVRPAENRQYIVPLPAQPRQSVVPAAVPRPTTGGTLSVEQPRFLTDPAAPVPVRPNAVEVVPPFPTPRGAPPEALSGDLPPQAYRGPATPPLGW